MASLPGLTPTTLRVKDSCSTPTPNTYSLWSVALERPRGKGLRADDSRRLSPFA